MRWNIDQRLAFIETRLYWEGQLNRKDLTDFFQISIPQASNDLKEYARRAPHNIQYDRRAKVYKAAAGFKPEIISTDPEEYFFLLKLTRSEHFSKQIFFGFQPDFYSLPFPQRKIDPNTLRRVLRVMRQHKALEIHYQSLTTPEPHWRWITPHALGFDGFRWHIRAFCHMRRAFRDFVPGRILSTGGERAHTVDAGQDLLWNTELVFKIAPHPQLSENQKKMIEYEYGMEKGQKQFKVKAAFSFYVMNRLRLDIDKNKSIILLNKDEIEKSRRDIELKQQSI
jgi:hypothetical protein